MNGRPRSFGTSGNPLWQALSLLVFGLLLIGAVVMGAVILMVVLGVAVIGAMALYARLWWLRRKLGRSAAARGAEPGMGTLIDAEYTVVEERDPRSPNDRRPRASSRGDLRVTAEDDDESDESEHAGR
jgi:hypothetical protein